MAFTTRVLTSEDVVASGGDTVARYDLYPSGSDQYLELAMLISNGSFRVKPGSRYEIFIPAGNGFAISCINKESVIDWGGSTVVYHLDLTNPAQAFRNLILISGSPNFRWTNMKIDFNPAVASQGVVTALTTTTIDLDILPSFWPTAWATSGMDTFGKYDVSLDAITDWQYNVETLDGARQPAAYPIVQRLDLGPNRWQMQFPQTSAAITAVANYSPLTLTIPNNGWSDGQFVLFDNTCTGLVQDGVSLINNKLWKVRLGNNDDDDTGNNVRLIQPNSNAIVNANSATAWVSGGIGTSQPVPSFVTVGDTLPLILRKRGGNPFVINNCYRPYLQVETAGSCAGFINGKGNTDPTFSIVTRGRGIIGTNADTLLLQDTRGTLTLEKFDCSGSGDTFYATPTTSIDGSRVSSFTANTITVSAWTNVLNKDTLPTMPVVGDIYRYIEPVNGELDPLQNPVTAVSGNTVTLLYNHPTGYNMTWKILNQNLNTRTVAGDINVKHSFTVALAIQSGDFSADSVNVQGSHGEALRFSNPGVGFSSRNIGALGRINILRTRIRNSHWIYDTTRNSAVSARRRNQTNSPPSQYQDLPHIELGDFELDGSGFGGIGAIGRDIRCKTSRIRRTGLLRATNPTFYTDPQALNDLYAAQGSVVCSSQLSGTPTVYRDTGGIVTPTLNPVGVVTSTVDTDTSHAGNQYNQLLLTGARTAARTLTLPSVGWLPGVSLRITNSTTGGFAMTVKNLTSGGTTLATLTGAKFAVFVFQDSTSGWALVESGTNSTAP